MSRTKKWKKEYLDREKEEPREIGTNETGNIDKVALFMPGPHQTCHKLATKKGMDKKKLCHFVQETITEEGKKVAKELQKYIDKNNLNAKVIKKRLEKFNAIKELDGKKYDVVFADVCGELNTQMAYWIGTQAKEIFAKKTYVCWTFSVIGRNNELYQNLLEIRNGNIPFITNNNGINENWFNKSSFENNLRLKREITSQALEDCLYSFDIEYVTSKAYKGNTSKTPMLFISQWLTLRKNIDNERYEIFKELVKDCSSISGTKEFFERIGRPKITKAKYNKIVVSAFSRHIDYFNIKKRKDVKKVGIQAAITRYSNKFGYDRNKVIAGINSSLTRMGL